MAVAYVSAQSGNNSGTGTTLSVTPGTAIAIGSLVFVTIGYQFTSATNNAITAAAGSDNFTVETAVNLPNQAGLSNFFFTTGYFINTTASHTSVTATLPTGSTFTDMTVSTFSGFGAGTLNHKIAPLGIYTNGGLTVGANSTSSGNYSATAGDLLFGAGLDGNGNGTISAGTTLAWVQAQSIAGVAMTEYILSSAGGTVAATFGNSISTDNTWGVAAYSFTPGGTDVLMAQVCM